MRSNVNAKLLNYCDSNLTSGCVAIYEKLLVPVHFRGHLRSKKLWHNLPPRLSIFKHHWQHSN
jgi:hypothetical protein